MSEETPDLVDRLKASLTPYSPRPEEALESRLFAAEIEDEDENPLNDIADQVDGVVASWDGFDPDRDNLEELRGAVWRLRRLAERATS